MVKRNVADATNNMITATSYILDLCVKHKVEKIVYASSSMVYGDWPSGGHFYGMREDWNQMQPKSDQGILKLASEGIVKRYCNEHNVEYTIVRPSAVYGPRDIIDRVVP